MVQTTVSSTPEIPLSPIKSGGIEVAVGIWGGRFNERYIYTGIQGCGLQSLSVKSYYCYLYGSQNILLPSVLTHLTR